MDFQARRVRSDSVGGALEGPSTGPAHRDEEALGKNVHFGLSPSPSPMLWKAKMDLFTG